VFYGPFEKSLSSLRWGGTCPPPAPSSYAPAQILPKTLARYKLYLCCIVLYCIVLHCPNALIVRRMRWVRSEDDKTAMRPFVKLRWTLVIKNNPPFVLGHCVLCISICNVVVGSTFSGNSLQ